MMNRIGFGGFRTFLLAAIALSGLIFAVLLLASSVSVIGFGFAHALKYGLAVFMVWFIFDVLVRFGGAWPFKHEPLIIMAVFFLMYVIFLQIVPELGQIKMPYDSLRAQKSLEAGRFVFFRPIKFYYWINYDFVLSALGMVFAPKLIVGQILNAVCRTLALYPVFMLCERVAGRNTARFVTIMIGLSPALTIYASTLVGDFMSALFYLYAVYVFLSIPNWDSLSKDSISLWMLVGLLAGLGYMFKTVSFLYFFAFAVWMVVKGLESRNLKGVLLLCLSFAIITMSHGMVKSARSSMSRLLCSESKTQTCESEGFAAGILYEIYLGMCIQTRGEYSPSRDKAIRAVPVKKKLEMVKDMFVRDMKNYPQFIVYKFRSLWGSNDSNGSVLDWFRMSCQKDCYNPKDRNVCAAWLKPLLRAEHLFFTVMFLLGAGGLVLSMCKDLKFTGVGIISLILVLSFVAMSMLIESHGRYRTAIYPFFFLILPYACIWLKRDNPLYVRVGERVRKLIERVKGAHDR